MSDKSRLLLGIDVFKNDFDLVLKKRNIALITGSSVVDSSCVPVYQTVKKKAGKRFISIWSLQHGFFIDRQDNMILSDSFYWNQLDCEVHSLYGKNRLPEEELLKDIDALVIDIFDLGTRVYTYLNHMVLIMKHLSGRGIDFIVLDRPNPLNGIMLEGNVLSEGYESIVGTIPVPMRHGLTAGEYLSFALTFYDLQLNLEVGKLKNWNRKNYFKGIWIYPSPNMPSHRTAMVYPGAVMLEGTNISEGRGTTRPFEFVGSPFLDHQKLIKGLKFLELKGVSFIPIFFKPEFSKYSGKVCQGILVVPDAVDEFNSFRVYYEIIRLIKLHHPDQFQWRKPPYEFENERPPIDMICGSDFIRKSLEKNLSYSEIKPDIDSQIQMYKEHIDHFLLY
ncbi:MAG: DUF1343 domain-containing protein [Candidatus Aminicenantes bacterium]|nr:DUF1343 domain-containing protein [Candidatus Aminicenantes bacterium]